LSPLFEIAKKAGENLYGVSQEDQPHHGLTWYDEEHVQHVNVQDIVFVSDADYDGHEKSELCPFTDDYEYQFHPSTGIGVDCGVCSIESLTPDVDGNIYLYYPDAGIRVVHTKNDWSEVDGPM